MTESTQLATRPEEGAVDPPLGYAVNALVRPAAPPDVIRQVLQQYKEVAKAIFDPDDFVESVNRKTGEKTFQPKKGYFDKMAVAFSASCEVVAEHEVRDDDGKILRWRVRVRAIAPNGRYAEGTGVCSVIEDRYHPTDRDGNVLAWKERQMLASAEHDVYATAETRGTVRAYSRLFSRNAIDWSQLDKPDQGGTERRNGQGGSNGHSEQRSRQTPSASPFRIAFQNAWVELQREDKETAARVKVTLTERFKTTNLQRLSDDQLREINLEHDLVDESSPDDVIEGEAREIEDDLDLENMPF